MRPELDDTLAAPRRPASDSTSGAADSAAATAPRTPAGPAGNERTATAPRTSSTLPAEPGLTTGQRLGHFRIERLLGAGGMGEVYLATDLALERPVAIKVLPDGSASEAHHRDRLIREARAQAQITHPNVGHIYFIGEEAGRLYFAMEYVAGETVSERVAKGPLTVDDALSIVRSAALGLREAQRHGITHRDIKPSNLMIDGHGIVKVLDFGLAAGALGELTQGPVAQTSLAGTPLYMAPEQARGEPIDFRADIYALGATLFHLVSGRPPFEADSLPALLSKHSSADRPLIPRRAGQPRTTIAAIDALCGRMMALVPERRFASYDELIRAIELASAEHMRPAGLWVRLMAATADLMFAMVLALVVTLPFMLFKAGGNVFGLFLMLLYPVYRSVLIARTGRTLGQWLFELEVVDIQTGERPSLRRAAIRTLIPCALPLISTVIEHAFELGGYQLHEVPRTILSATAFLPPLALLWASFRSVNKQTVWDKLSHTMVRYRARRTTTL
jgi:uncharacterized RDD family membrane protein YckC